ncbi:hypothetical protein SEA_FIZZLES_72 [Microbacterium phage Fizzles]|nr:hypothetical protein SEA_FIZZLES_72 [Microbacterium phage Fizzles]
MSRGRPRGSRDIPWQHIITRLREYPGRWMLFPEMVAVNVRTITVIRKRERRALRLDDGVIRCRRKGDLMAASDDTVVCTLYLKYEPKGLADGP